ncbi:VOC family protein [Devosia sediminis]|uniref:VOC domain-containing protein n=1 Tax=Devosia sediminis TaxID=2798801 RepID=A0A934MJC8_9HYPH|nr:VOC family protein [Devosia sediminis]MBJ3783918.1 hypothetical protein [Devosia sediminis]
MTTLVHVEITAANAAETASFYADVLAVESNTSPFIANYLILTGTNGPVGAVMGNSYQSQATIAWFAVDDIEAALERALAGGGKTFGQISTIPGQGKLSYVSDPNGTVFGLRQPE